LKNPPFEKGGKGGICGMIPYHKNLKQRSRDLRKNMTDAERKLWSAIRMKQIRGLPFYRQKPIGNYVVDFYCPAAKLVIEVDGGQHFEAQNAEYDRRRDEFLKSQGLNVIRFTNLDVLKNIDGVVQTIIEKVG
jgi:very-short-patch-repair endonuclease